MPTTQATTTLEDTAPCSLLHPRVASNLRTESSISSVDSPAGLDNVEETRSWGIRAPGNGSGRHNLALFPSVGHELSHVLQLLDPHITRSALLGGVGLEDVLLSLCGHVLGQQPTRGDSKS
jgi:hypothetical protein